MTFNSPADDEESEEFDLRPPCPELFHGTLPNFDILGLLGSGGMGRVYKARQPNLDRVVALKVLSGSAVDEEILRFGERFQREATAMARLRHPNIVTLYHYGETDQGQVYFVMEYIEGAELTAYIRSADAEPRHVLYWAIQICNALQFAHESGIVHRDIKPSNLLIDKNGDVKIADFGLAKFSRRDGNEAETRLTLTDVVVGTPHYIAPELLEDPTAVSPSCDLYSLGVTLYQALTGLVPRGIPSPPSQLLPGLDPRWDGILFRCLASAPGERFQSAADLQDALEELLDGSDLIPSTSLRASVRGAPVKIHSPGSMRWNPFLGGVIVVSILVAAAYFTQRMWNPSAAVVDRPPSMTEVTTRLPAPIPLQLTVPERSGKGGRLAILNLEDESGSVIQAKIVKTSGDLVRIWERPGGGGISGLRADGTIWTQPEESVTDSPELSDLVWLDHTNTSTGALRADGHCFLWNQEGNLSPVGGAGSFVMILADPDGGAILLSRDGEVRRSGRGKSESTEAIPAIGGECLAIGGYGNLLATMSRSGSLRIWQFRPGPDGIPELLHEREIDGEIRKEDANPSPYPDRWIPVLPWAVISPDGKVLPFNEAAAHTSLLPLESIRPGTFRFGGSIGAGYMRRTGVTWAFSGPWESNRIDALKVFTEGAEQFVLSGSSAFALFPPALDIAARFEMERSKAPKPQETPPEPDKEMLERTWRGERVEILTRGESWDETSARLLIDAVETELAIMEPILAGWGATCPPQKLVITQGNPETESSWEAGTVNLASGHLDTLLTSLRERKLGPADIDFLPPAEAFRPLAQKLNPTDSRFGFFGEAESHLADFCHLFGTMKTGTAAEESFSNEAWEEKKALMTSLIVGENYRPENAMKDPGTGEKFFSGLLVRLHDDYGGKAFLDRFFHHELSSLPDSSSTQEGIDHFVIAASLAAERDLVTFFRDELRWPVSAATIEMIGQRFPAAGNVDAVTEFRQAPDDLLSAWEKIYEEEVLPLTLAHRAQLEELRANYRDALQRRFLQLEAEGRTSSAKVFREERDSVTAGHAGPPSFHPVRHRALDEDAQEAVRELDTRLGRTYRERLRALATDASSSAGGKMSRSLDELYRLQHLFTLEGKDPAAQWAFDRREREVKTHSLESVYSPRIPLDLTMRYEEIIRWAVGEGATVELVQPITPSQVQHYTVRSIADVQAGRFVWQRLKILEIRRGAEVKPWSDIHLELISRFEDLEVLECGCGELRGATLEALSGLPKLKKLSLRGAKFEPSDTAGLVALGRMKLDGLSLAGADIPQEALSILAAGPISASLEELELANTKMVDLLPLSGFRKLKRLDISGCAVPQENIEEFNRVRRDCLVVK